MSRGNVKDINIIAKLISAYNLFGMMQEMMT